jgi:hypothetical protein
LRPGRRSRLPGTGARHFRHLDRLTEPLPGGTLWSRMIPMEADRRRFD